MYYLSKQVCDWFHILALSYKVYNNGDKCAETEKFCLSWFRLTLIFFKFLNYYALLLEVERLSTTFIEAISIDENGKQISAPQ